MARDSQNSLMKVPTYSSFLNDQKHKCANHWLPFIYFIIFIKLNHKFDKKYYLIF